MATTRELKTEFGNIVEKLHYILSVITNYHKGHDTSVLEKPDIDKKLLKEISNCCSIIKGMEQSFVEILLQDAKDIANVDISEKAVLSLDKIENVLEEFGRIMYKESKKSEFLIDLSYNAKDKIKEIKNTLEEELKIQEEQKKRLMWERTAYAAIGG